MYIYIHVKQKLQIDIRIMWETILSRAANFELSEWLNIPQIFFIGVLLWEILNI